MIVIGFLMKQDYFVLLTIKALLISIVILFWFFPISYINQLNQLMTTLSPVSGRQNTFLLYKEVRSTLKIPLKVEIYFNLLQHSLTQNFTAKGLKNKQGFSKQFIKAFMTLSKKQRQEILLANISALFLNYYSVATIDEVQQQNNEKQKQLLTQLSSYDKLQNCEGKCQMLVFVFGLPYWQKADFNLQAKKRIMTVHSGNSILLDLRMYLMRKSKKHERTLVLEAVSAKAQKQYERVSLSFKDETHYDKVFQSMFNCIVGYRNNQLVEEFQNCIDEERQNTTQVICQNSGISMSVRPLVFLNERNINEYLANKKTLSSYLQILSDSFFPIYNRNDCTIYKSSQDSSFYKLQNTFHKSRQDVKALFFTNLKKYSFIVKWEVMETFSHKYQAIYQKFYIKGKKVDQIVIQQQKRQSAESDEIMFVKHVDSIINKSFMEFCIFYLEKLPGASCKLSIYGCFNPLLLGGAEKLLLVLEEYVNIITGQTTQNFGHTETGYRDSKDQFYTIMDEFNNGALTEFQKRAIQKQIQTANKQLQIIQQASLHREVSQKILTPMKQSSNQVNPIDKYLFHKYIQQALAKQSLTDKIEKANWLQVDWKRAKGGGLCCKNEKVIEQQRKLYKKLLVSFGQQIIKTKGILNMSIPVIIFKKESQLHSMAKTFKMAPFFLQKAHKASDPMQRFKQALAGMISINSLNLSFEKPFNPILGQTLQMSVNGCPIYVQQISHHPPITSYYFVGRGYRLYGTAEIKIDIGLNNAKGYSQLSHTIEFDDGHKIQFNYPKLLIGGMLFGERTFNFEGKTFMYDSKNKIFADIYFGQTKKTFFASESHPQDEVSGKIYKVKPSFEDYYNKTKPLITEIDPKDIDSELQPISGIWNVSMKIGNQAYTQFVGQNIDPIYELEEDQFVLPSDSRYRMDLRYLIEGKVDKAQDAKVQMEQRQRKQKKLRIQYAQKKKK